MAMKRRLWSLGLFIAAVVCVAVAYPELCQRRPATCPLSEPVTSSPPATPEPVTVPPPRLATPPARPDAAPAAHTKPADEHALLVQLRALVKTNPARAEALARESRQRFPAGAEADERDALLVDALINQQRIGAARDETYYYFDHHPQGRFAEHLFTMTGVHPAPRRPGP
jgi:hypothetical protein